MEIYGVFETIYEDGDIYDDLVFTGTYEECCKIITDNNKNIIKL